VAEFWRIPIQARSQYAADVPFIPGVPKLVHIISGPNAQEDISWLLGAKGCVNCLLKFPARPKKGHERLFYGNEWGRPWPEARRLIREEKCPACGWEVSFEMARAYLVADQWSDPSKPGAVPL
jgi:hypothetical protein